MGNVGNPVYLRDVATTQKITSPSEYDRINRQRFITISANIYNQDLGTSIIEVTNTIASLGELPAGVKIDEIKPDKELIPKFESK